MKVGDIVTMKQALTPERYGLGLIQKIVSVAPTVASSRAGVTRFVYHILWPDGGISNQYNNEIVLWRTTE